MDRLCREVQEGDDEKLLAAVNLDAAQRLLTKSAGHNLTIVSGHAAFAAKARWDNSTTLL